MSEIVWTYCSVCKIPIRDYDDWKLAICNVCLEMEKIKRQSINQKQSIDRAVDDAWERSK